jgi:hypothetical protein
MIRTLATHTILTPNPSIHLRKHSSAAESLCARMRMFSLMFEILTENALSLEQQRNFYNFSEPTA